MKALLVDDDPDVIVLASYVLENLGKFEVISSAGGYEVIDLARTERPDVILMDFMMPAPDGAELARELASDPRTAEIPLIFVTAKDSDAERQKLLELGARAVMTKPFDPESLAYEVRGALAGKTTPSTGKH